MIDEERLEKLIQHYKTMGSQMVGQPERDLITEILHLRSRLALAEKVVEAARVEFKSGSLSDYSKFLDALRAYDAALAEWERGKK